MPLYWRQLNIHQSKGCWTDFCVVAMTHCALQQSVLETILSMNLLILPLSVLTAYLAYHRAAESVGCEDWPVVSTSFVSFIGASQPLRSSRLTPKRIGTAKFEAWFSVKTA